jgi:glycosyltransferase involved in cell wall biosynthesis
MLKLTMWLVVPSFYQGDVLRALVATGELDLEAIFARPLPEDRIQLGWENDLAGYSFRFLNETNRIMDAVRLVWSRRDRIHMVNGMWMEPSFAAALTALAATGGTYAIYSEAPDPNISRSVAKKLFATAFGRMIVARASGFFPVSHLGVEFFKRLRARPENIYPYGYFRSHSKPSDSSMWRDDEDRIEVVFLGQVVQRKGIDVLLEAMKPLFEEHPTLYLTIIGAGDLLDGTRRQVDSSDLMRRIEFEGTLPSHQVLSRLKNADLLVLPSRWDGWGIVINEAFAVGMPVVVSNRCGASELVRNGVNGYVFRNEDVVDLRACLKRFLTQREEWASFRAASSTMAEKISAEAVAPYLIKSLKHMVGLLDEQPTPPWMQSDEFESVKVKSPSHLDLRQQTID